MKMRAARMYGYKQPLRLEEIPVLTPGPEEVLVKVGGAGMCRTDFQLIDGYFDTGCRWTTRSRPATRSRAGWTASEPRCPRPPACPRATRSWCSAAGVRAPADSATRATNNCDQDARATTFPRTTSRR